MSLLPPDPDDLDNVRALNQRFIELLVDDGSGVLAALPCDLAAEITALDAEARERLAASPFLLFLPAEDTDSRQRGRDTARDPDLFDAASPPAAAVSRLQAAALGFLWELARRRPYAARALGGLPADRCAILARSTPVALFTDTSVSTDALRLRAGDDATFWRRLVVGAQSDDPSVAEAARMAALQTVLAQSAGDDVRLPAAACSMRIAARKVAERRPVSDGGVRGYNTPPDERAADKKSDEDLRER